MTTHIPTQSMAGEILGDEHRLKIRVYYEDTDFTGVVYHANYLRYFERGRSDFLRLLGVHHHRLAELDPPLAFAVAQINVRYKATARIDDILTVSTRLAAAKGAQFFIDQAISRDGTLIAGARLDIVCIDGQGRPRRMPRDLAEVINRHIAAPKPGENA